MKLFPALLGAAIAGAIGAVVWVLIVHYTGYELGLVAWGIGVLVGVAAAAASRGEGGTPIGVGAAVCALLAVMAGKYAGSTIVYSEIMERFDDHSMIVGIADDIVMAREEAGEQLEWPEGSTIEDAYAPEDYPAGIWADAQNQWETYSTSEQRSMKSEIALRGLNFVLTQEGEEPIEELSPMSLVVSDLSPFDALWVILACFSAFKIGSGKSD